MKKKVSLTLGVSDPWGTWGSRWMRCSALAGRSRGATKMEVVEEEVGK